MSYTNTRSQKQKKKKSFGTMRHLAWLVIWGVQVPVKQGEEVTLQFRFLGLKWKKERDLTDFLQNSEMLADENVMSVSTNYSQVNISKQATTRWGHPKRDNGVLVTDIVYIQSRYHMIGYYSFHIRGLLDFLHVVWYFDILFKYTGSLHIYYCILFHYTLDHYTLGHW